MDFEQRVYDQEFKMNDTDDSVVEYLRKHRKGIQNLSIHKIAEDLFVSPTAVMRTSKKLGYSGFSELKFCLQAEDTPTQIKTAESHVLGKLPENIVRTVDVMDENMLHTMVDSMIGAKKILFAGIGDSVYFCELFGRSLRCLDRPVEYFQQIHDMEYAARRYTQGDMIIVISASGKPERLVALAQNAVQNGAVVYCMTNFGRNPLADVCMGQLCFWGEQRIVNGYNVTDRSGLMMLVRLLCEEFWKKFCV